MKQESELVQTADNEESQDGRRVRSERSRRKIIDAMLDLVKSGKMQPGAANIAKAAGVSLRTVFRHFEEIDSLYREMYAQLEVELLPAAMVPWKSEHWRDRLDELISRRHETYPGVQHLKVSASMRRFQSTFLMEADRKFVQFEGLRVASILPPEIVENEELFTALNLAVGFGTWYRLVADHDMSWDEAATNIRYIVAKLLADL